MRKNEVALLPSPKTLKAYTGSSRADVGFTDLIKERLLMEKKNLTEQQLKVHLIVDAAAIKPVEAYMKNVDKLVGHVDMAGVVEPVEEGALANKLLTFVINGLSKSFSIIVGYFLVKKLTASQLLELTKHVIKEIEALGFQVEGLVADNASTNTKMFKLLNPEGILCHQVPHPNDKKRILFLSFDSSHIIKNVRNQFIDRPLKWNGKRILFDYVKRLYEKQKNTLLKPVRKLSKKHLELTKIERQNVGKALDIFSRDLVAAMETYRRQNVSGFVDCQETIMFMKRFIKWFEIHDSCNLTQAILKRLPNKAPFSSENDERLQWLEAFLKWLKS